jgi:hypothetical protein
MSGPADLPAEAVEAAAAVIYSEEVGATEDYEAPDWDELPDGDRAQWLIMAERALAAALPPIRAHIADQPQLGLATTRQLLDEIAARIDVDYSSGGGGLDYTTVGGRPNRRVARGGDQP